MESWSSGTVKWCCTVRARRGRNEVSLKRDKHMSGIRGGNEWRNVRESGKIFFWADSTCIDFMEPGRILKSAVERDMFIIQ